LRSFDRWGCAIRSLRAAMRRAPWFRFAAYGTHPAWQPTRGKGTLTSVGLPWITVDLCKALDEPVVLPEFMNKLKKLYGRQVNSSIAQGFPTSTPTPTVTETLPWGENPSTFPSKSFDGSRFVVFAADTSISTFFSTTTLASGAAAYTSAVTAQRSPAITEIIGVAEGTNSTTPSSSPINTIYPPSRGLSSGAKVGIGVGLALVAIALALGLGWFIIVYRRRTRHAATAEIQREKNDGGLPEHISTMDKIPIDSTSPGKYFQSSRGNLPQEVAGTQVQIRNELPASNSTATQRHELHESPAGPQRIELGSGAENQIQESSRVSSKSNIQRKAVSPGQWSFPAPWTTSPQQGNKERPEESGIGQPQEEIRTNRADEMVIEPDDQDPELLRLEEEMAKVKVERERLQRLQDLELREQQLKKTIEERRQFAGGSSTR
jgi:hypothetical protein